MSIATAYLPQLLALLGIGIGALVTLGSSMVCACSEPEALRPTRLICAGMAIFGAVLFFLSAGCLARLAMPV